MRDKSFFERIFIMLIAMEFVLLAGVLIAQWSVVSKSSMDEITAGSEDKLGVIKWYSEAVLRDIEKTTLYIALDENISVLDTMREKDLGDIDKVFRLYKLVDFLKLQKSVDNRIASIYIYQDELDMVITSDGDICKSSDFSDSEWKKYYNKDSAFVWMGKRTLGKGAEADAVITLVYPFKNINSSTNYAAVANVSLSALSDSVLTRYKGENSSVCIIDTNGQIIAEDMDKSCSIDKIAEVSDGRSILNNKIPYTCDVSEYNGWKYVNAVSVRFPDNWRSIVGGILAAGLCMLVVGILISYFISKRIAGPIEQLMKKIDFGRQGDEFEIINEAFETMRKKEKLIEVFFRRGRCSGGIPEKMPCGRGLRG